MFTAPIIVPATAAVQVLPAVQAVPAVPAIPAPVIPAVPGLPAVGLAAATDAVMASATAPAPVVTNHSAPANATDIANMPIDQALAGESVHRECSRQSFETEHCC